MANMPVDWVSQQRLLSGHRSLETFLRVSLWIQPSPLFTLLQSAQCVYVCLCVSSSFTWQQQQNTSKAVRGKNNTSIIIDRAYQVWCKMYPKMSQVNSRLSILAGACNTSDSKCNFQKGKLISQWLRLLLCIISHHSIFLYLLQQAPFLKILIWLYSLCRTPIRLHVLIACIYDLQIYTLRKTEKKHDIRIHQNIKAFI